MIGELTFKDHTLPVSRVVGEVCGVLRTAAHGGEQDTEALAASLCAHGLAAGHYHADMDPSERMRVHTAWSAGKASRQVGSLSC